MDWISASMRLDADSALRARSSVGERDGTPGSTAINAAAASGGSPTNISPASPASPRAADSLRACCWRLITSPWWTALVLVVVLALGAIGELWAYGLEVREASGERGDELSWGLKYRPASSERAVLAAPQLPATGFSGCI